jgi:hypothetical protein
MDEYSYSEWLKKDLPCEPCPEYRLTLNNMDEVAYTVTHNMFKETDSEKEYLHLELALYDENYNHLDTVRLNKEKKEHTGIKS